MAENSDLGGAGEGLPATFANRFTVINPEITRLVFGDELRPEAVKHHTHIAMKTADAIELHALLGRMIETVTVSPMPRPTRQ